MDEHDLMPGGRKGGERGTGALIDTSTTRPVSVHGCGKAGSGESHWPRARLGGWQGRTSADCCGAPGGRALPLEMKYAQHGGHIVE